MEKLNHLFKTLSFDLENEVTQKKPVRLFYRYIRFAL